MNSTQVHDIVDLMNAEAAMRAERDAALAEVQRLREAHGWQPIDTAPKDGTPVDLWVPLDEGGYRITDVSWREPTEDEYWSNGSEEPSPEDGTFGPEKQWFWFMGHPITDATHWMPIPDGPDEARALVSPP